MSKINGHPIGATIVPTDTADTYATHTEEYGKGGYRSVKTMDDRDAIPLARLKEGMRVFVTANGNTYYLKSLDEGNPVWELDTYLYADKLLVSPTLSRTWKVYPYNTPEFSDDTLVDTQITQNITVETGYTVTYSGTFVWQSASGKKNPETCFVNNVEMTLPKDGAEVTIPTSTFTQNLTKATESKSTTVTLKAAKKGFMTNGTSVVVASGVDTTSATDRVTFQGRLYYGPSTKNVDDIGEADIKKLESQLISSRANTKTGVSTNKTQYYVYAYPSTYGELTSIIQNRSTPVLDAFSKPPKKVKITNAAGLEVELLVYVSANPGAFTGVELAFS